MFLGDQQSWLQWMVPSMMMWIVNAVIVGFVLAKLFVFGEPVTKPLSEPSVSYWRNRKQADINLSRVSSNLCILLQ